MDINEFLDNRKIESKVLRDILSDYVKDHTELFGHIVSEEMLLSRLDGTLKELVMIPREEKPEIMGNDPALYKGFDKNRFIIFCTEKELESLTLGPLLRDVINHEITHAAYTIKNDDIDHSDTSVFGTRIEVDSADPYSPELLMDGHDDLCEPVINYISSQISSKQGIKSVINVAQTHQISRIADRIGGDSFVESAWNSDENLLKEKFSTFSVQSAYEEFIKGVRYIRTLYKDGREFIDNMLFEDFASSNNDFDGLSPDQVDGMINEFQSTTLEGYECRALDACRNMQIWRRENIVTKETPAKDMEKTPTDMTELFALKDIGAAVAKDMTPSRMQMAVKTIKDLISMAKEKFNKGREK